MKLSQLPALLDDAVRAEGERQAAMIMAVNLGSHGKKLDIERTLRKLTQSEEKPMGLDDAMKMAKKS